VLLLESCPGPCVHQCGKGPFSFLSAGAWRKISTPTGGAVISDENAGSGLPLASIAIVSIIVLLFFVYGRKR